MFWPLIVGFIVVVALTVLIGWLTDTSRRGGTGADEHH
jgi:hypothetical protein